MITLQHSFSFFLSNSTPKTKTNEILCEHTVHMKYESLINEQIRIWTKTECLENKNFSFHQNIGEHRSGGCGGRVKLSVEYKY